MNARAGALARGIAGGWACLRRAGGGAAQTADIVDRSALKICADPSNLPFSNEQKQGFENKIAEIMGTALGLKVDYTWFPQVIGFARNTLQAHRCDLVMGTVAGDDIMQTTNPYYFTTYVMIYRSDKGFPSRVCRTRGWRACASAWSAPHPLRTCWCATI